MSPVYARIGLVQADPMTRQDYNDLRGWTLPANENGDDAGYVVAAYERDHVAWMPKAEFEALHQPVADAEEGDLSYVLRMRAELAELEGRLAKLLKYLDTDQSRNLPFEDLTLLRAQRMAMEGYKEILNRRLCRATVTPETTH